jgi:hypothetical protein
MTPRLTIVMPLKGRHLFTFRFLWHANQMRLPYRFLLADGHVNEAVARRLEDGQKLFSELDIEYVRYPDDVDYSRLYAKMADVSQRVRTPYAMIADNDDFYRVVAPAFDLQRGIGETVALLETANRRLRKPAAMIRDHLTLPVRRAATSWSVPMRILTVCR